MNSNALNETLLGVQQCLSLLEHCCFGSHSFFFYAKSAAEEPRSQVSWVANKIALTIKLFILQLSKFLDVSHSKFHKNKINYQYVLESWFFSKDFFFSDKSLPHCNQWSIVCEKSVTIFSRISKINNISCSHEQVFIQMVAK